MNRLRSLIVLPLAAAAFLAAIARGQLTCDAPQQVQLGATPTAILLSFPAAVLDGNGCQGTQTIHHAVYHRFTAAQDGWYSVHLVPTGPELWYSRLALLDSCGTQAAQGYVRNLLLGYPRCDEGAYPNWYFSAGSIWLSAGQSCTIVSGSASANESGSASIYVARFGSTLMDGSQELHEGDNPFAMAAREPVVPFSGSCGNMPSASRFRFTPAKTGTYRFSFCNTSRVEIALSSSPNLPAASLVTGAYGCSGDGGRLTTQLTAGTEYYLAAGLYYHFDACATDRIASVEYVPPCPADFNDDDVTDGIDLGMLLAAWGTPARDITGDGTTDGVDLGILLAMWGTCPEG